MRKLAIIGAGNICRQVVEVLSPDTSSKERQGDSFLIAVLKRRDAGSGGAAGIHAVFADIDDLLAWKPDLVVEAAGQDAVRQYAGVCLERGVPFLVSSVGALADEGLYMALQDAARQGKSRLLIPPGAIGGLDYVRAAALFDRTSVTYESRKPPSAWMPELRALGIDPDRVVEPLELFAGSADEAATRYPKNLNVAATLALAGVGMRDTLVRVIVDPNAPGNQHAIKLNGPAGTFVSRLANKPSPGNPKTSWIVSRSIVSTIRRYFEPCWIG